jgi:hypothetical protein
LENGWQTRQKRKTDTAHHRTFRVLWKNFQASLGQKENLNAKHTIHHLFLFFMLPKRKRSEKVCLGDAFVYSEALQASIAIVYQKSSGTEPLNLHPNINP